MTGNLFFFFSSVNALIQCSLCFSQTWLSLEISQESWLGSKEIAGRRKYITATGNGALWSLQLLVDGLSPQLWFTGYPAPSGVTYHL